MASANILAFAVINAWTSTTVVGQMMASIHVAYDKSTIGYFVDVNFNVSMLQKFHSCLCDDSAADCVAHYGLVHDTVTDVTAEGTVANGQISHTYKCSNDASRARVICEQQSPQALPDYSSGNVLSQSFLITQSPCGSTCIVFIWQFPMEDMNYDDSVGAANCGTICACTRRITAAVTSPAATSQISPIPIEPKTTGTLTKIMITTLSKAMKTSGSVSSSTPPPTTTIITTTTTTTTTNKAITTAAAIARTTTTTTTTSMSNVISNHDSFPTTAADLGTKTLDEDTPIIVGVVIGVIIVTAAFVIGVIIWKRRRAASGLREKMHHQTDTPKEARTQGPKPRNKMDGTSDTQLSSTGNLDLEGKAFAVPHRTKQQHDAIPADIAKNGTNSIVLTSSRQYVNEKNAPDHEYTNDNRGSIHRSNLRKSENNRMAKESISGNKGKKPKRNKAEDDFGYAFAEDPPDQDKGQQLNSSTVLSPQRTSFSNRGCSGEDYGYASVDDVDVFGGGNGGTGPDYENWIENTLESKNYSYDIESKRKNIPSTLLVGNVRNIDRSSEIRNYGYSYTDQEFSEGSKATTAFSLVKACGSGNSDYEYPVMESDYDSVSVNGNTQTNDKPDTWTQNIDDDNSTAGSESLSRKPSSDTCSNSKNVDAKHHDELREMDNPYNNLLSLKEDLTAVPSQNNLLDNQSARYSNIQSIRKAFSSCESAETIRVTDVASTEL